MFSAYYRDLSYRRNRESYHRWLLSCSRTPLLSREQDIDIVGLSLRHNPFAPPPVPPSSTLPVARVGQASTGASTLTGTARSIGVVIPAVTSRGSAKGAKREASVEKDTRELVKRARVATVPAPSSRALRPPAAIQPPARFVTPPAGSFMLLYAPQNGEKLIVPRTHLVFSRDLVWLTRAR